MSNSNACLPTTAESRPISRLWNELFDPYVGFEEGSECYPRELSGTYPAIEVKEEKDHYLMTAELPGLTKDDISVEVKNGLLTISGEKKLEKSEKKEGYFYSERSYGKFSRSFRLDEDISEENVEASFKEGVLHVTLRKEKGKESKRITVK